MKAFASLFLILLLLLQCSMKLGIVAYYHFNTAYITANYCENKANVNMKCNGKCYLNKKIKAQEQRENKVPSLLKEIKEVLLFVSQYSVNLPPVRSMPETRSYMSYVDKAYSAPAAAIFQPPQ